MLPPVKHIRLSFWTIIKPGLCDHIVVYDVLLYSNYVSLNTFICLFGHNISDKTPMKRQSLVSKLWKVDLVQLTVLVKWIHLSDIIFYKT